MEHLNSTLDYIRAAYLAGDITASTFFDVVFILSSAMAR